MTELRPIWHQRFGDDRPLAPGLARLRRRLDAVAGPRLAKVLPAAIDALLGSRWAAR